MKFKKVNGLLVPIEENKQDNSPAYLKQFNCPHCGYYHDDEANPLEQKTVGQAGPGPHIPHSDCPVCGMCMGCESDEKPTKWNCPHCGRFFDSEVEPHEEATIAGIRLPGRPNLPHAFCPGCKGCMGC